MAASVVAVVLGAGLSAGVGQAGGTESAAPPRLAPETPVSSTDLFDNVANNSPQLAVDPTDGRFIVAANRIDAPFNCALQVSGDRGAGWVTAVPIPKLPAGADTCYGPEVAFDRSGRLYFLFVGLTGAGNSPMGAFLVHTDDRGRTFSAPQRVLPRQRYQVRLAIDPTMGERGRIHLVWLEPSDDPPLGGLPAGPNPIMTAHSDDGGATFSKPVQVSDPARQRVVAPAVVVGPDHAVHVVYYDLGDDVRDYQGLAGPAWDGNWSVVMSSSYDGGRQFQPSVVIDAGVVPPDRVMLIFTMAPPSVAIDTAGRLYAAWHDARNGDWDAFLARSTDGGRSWTGPQRLNDDRLRSGSHQYLPRLSVAPGGRVDAIFYDRRNNVENRGNDVYYTYSTDHGRTFAPNLRVTTRFFDTFVGPEYSVPSAEGMIEFGNRIALVSERHRAVAAWTDTRNTILGPPAQDIFGASIDFARPSGLPGWARGAGLLLILAGVAGGLAVRRGRSRVTITSEGTG